MDTMVIAMLYNNKAVPVPLVYSIEVPIAQL